MLDRALDLAPTTTTSKIIVSCSPAPESRAPPAASSLASTSSFRAVGVRFEELARFTVPRGVSDLIYHDAYLSALMLSRMPEVRVPSSAA